MVPGAGYRPSKIKTNKNGLKLLFNMLNIVKFLMPALEFSNGSSGSTRSRFSFIVPDSARNASTCPSTPLWAINPSRRPTPLSPSTSHIYVHPWWWKPKVRHNPFRPKGFCASAPPVQGSGSGRDAVQERLKRIEHGCGRCWPRHRSAGPFYY